MLIVLLLFLGFLLINKDSIQKNIIFLTKEELYRELVQNDDKYYNTFNKNDMNVRNITNINDYHKLIMLSTIDCDENNKNKIINCINIIKNKFNNIKFDYFDGGKFNNIKWQIGFVKGKLYEGGLPHTRNSTIILSDDYIQTINDKSLITLLIHEQIHIYQKLYPDDILKYLNAHNFTEAHITIKNKRANPDMNNKFYKDKDNNIYYSQYNDNPKKITDVTFYPINNSLYEHPFEKMAYELSTIY